MSGRIVYQIDKLIEPGIFQENINVAGLKKGIYLVKLDTNEKSVSGKLVIR